MNRSTVLSGLLLFAAACSSAPPYAAQAIEDDVEATANVVITDKALWDSLRIGRAGVERVPGTNQLKVIVPIRNITDGTVHVRVQVSFLDGNKGPLGDDTNQMVKLIDAGSTLPVIVISKLDTAQDWTMRISWDR